MDTKLHGTYNEIAAFNTQGWVKRQVTYLLKALSKSLGALNGIYIRTSFINYSFFPNFTSPSSDIKQKPKAESDIPELIRIANTMPNIAVFSTDSLFKSMINIQMTDKPTGLIKPWQGTYYRQCWPDFVCLPGLDSPGNVIQKMHGDTFYEIDQTCRNDPMAVPFNTNLDKKGRG